MWNLIAGIFLLVVMIAAFNFKDDFGNANSSKLSPHTVELPPLPHPTALVSISSYKWGKTSFGSVGVGYFTIKNDNAFSVKDIEVQCDFYANSGTHLSKAEATIYEVIGAKKSRTFNEVNLGFIHSQSTKTSCRIISVSR